MNEAMTVRASAPASPSTGEVHVWTVVLDGCGGLDQLECLSPDERARAERFRFDRDRHRFVATRVTLREILGNCLGVPARDVAFQYGPCGKPALAKEMESDVQFNLSHCRGVALVAVAAGRRVGVDLEFVSPRGAEGRIAERFFSAAEVTALRALPRELQEEAFFACWTRKEAYLKGRGEGLSIPLCAFSVSLAPGEPLALLGHAAAPEEARAWSLRSLETVPGFATALAVEGEGWRLEERSWDPGAPTVHGIPEFRE